MPRVSIESDTTFNKFFDMDQRKNKETWDQAEEAILDRQKNSISTVVGNTELDLDSEEPKVIVKQMSEEGDMTEKVLYLSSKGKTSLVNHLGIDGLLSALREVTSEKKSVVAAKNLIYNEVIKAKENNKVRLHFYRNGDKDELGYASTSRFALTSELECFRQIRQAADFFGYHLRRISIDEERVLCQLIQPAQEMPDPSHGGKPMYGMITVAVSEWAPANELSVGLYQSECKNGTVFGTEDDINVKVLRNAKTSFPYILKGLFEAAEHLGTKRMDLIARATEVPFGNMALKSLEAIVADPKHSAKVAYTHKLRDDVEAMMEKGSMLMDVVNRITWVAHQGNIAPQDSLKLERIAGKLLETAK